MNFQPNKINLEGSRGSIVMSWHCSWLVSWRSNRAREERSITELATILTFNVWIYDRMLWIIIFHASNLPGPSGLVQDVDHNPFDGPVQSKQQAIIRSMSISSSYRFVYSWPVPQAQDWPAVDWCCWGSSLGQHQCDLRAAVWWRSLCCCDSHCWHRLGSWKVNQDNLTVSLKSILPCYQCLVIKNLMMLG